MIFNPLSYFKSKSTNSQNQLNQNNVDDTKSKGYHIGVVSKKGRLSVIESTTNRLVLGQGTDAPSIAIRSEKTYTDAELNNLKSKRIDKIYKKITGHERWVLIEIGKNTQGDSLYVQVNYNSLKNKLFREDETILTNDIKELSLVVDKKVKKLEILKELQKIESYLLKSKNFMENEECQLFMTLLASSDGLLAWNNMDKAQKYLENINSKDLDLDANLKQYVEDIKKRFTLVLMSLTDALVKTLQNGVNEKLDFEYKSIAELFIKNLKARENLTPAQNQLVSSYKNCSK